MYKKNKKLIIFANSTLKFDNTRNKFHDFVTKLRIATGHADVIHMRRPVVTGEFRGCAPQILFPPKVYCSQEICFKHIMKTKILPP